MFAILGPPFPNHSGGPVQLGRLTEQMTLGEFEYKNSCVACHGSEGEGDGPIAQYLNVQTLPQLSMLQKNNGGVFHVQRVYAIIDGTEDVAVHGGRDMPVWGQRYRARLDPVEDMNFGPIETEAYVRTRILALIEYLAAMQVE
ncbi:cytochrome c family protein [Marimonas lutisalis]|uniref:c-type cytochrome n=1 Tax=Marimonas lutisalis TaxID=2545756 RepID=UPI0019606785|nr:c-type cytochrome [Marimonas lutisalis]